MPCNIRKLLPIGALTGVAVASSGMDARPVAAGTDPATERAPAQTVARTAHYIATPDVGLPPWLAAALGQF